MLHAYYRGIECLYNPGTNEICAYGWRNLLIQFNLWFDFKVLNLREIPIYVEDDQLD
jgi:hypothetical protein